MTESTASAAASTEIDGPFFPPRVIPPANWPKSRITLYFRMIDNFIAAWPDHAYDALFLDCRALVPKVVVASSPAALRQIFVTNRKNYVVAWQQAVLCRSLFGADSIAVANGSDWAGQRAIFNQALSPQRVGGAGHHIERYAQALAVDWEGRRGQSIQVDREFVRIAFRTVATLALSWSDSDYALSLADRLTDVRDSIGKVGAAAFFKLPRGISMNARGRGARPLDELRGRVAHEIAARRTSGNLGQDFLGFYLSARERGTSPDGDAKIVSNVITLFSSGYDTTATTMSWFAYVLASRPQLQALVRDELQTLVAKGEHLLPSAYARLDVSRRVFLETIRLYPPLPLLARQSLEADVIDGHAIAPGTTVFVSPYIVHRHRLLWDSPDQFDHDRFLPERASAIDDGRYLPFGAGERKCAGYHLAMFEILLVFSQILARHTLRVDQDHRIDIHSRVGLRMRGGIRLYAEPLA